MTGLSALSDEELMALYQQAKQPAPLPAQDAGPLAGMSDEDLLAAYQAQSKPQQPAYSGSILPFSRDQQGNVSFDSNAGIVGAVKRGLSMFGETAAGKFDPLDPKNTGRVMEAAAMVSPLSPAARAGGAAIPGMVRPPVPSAATLRASADAGYNAARDMGVDIAAEPVANLAQQLIRELEHSGRIAEAAPKTHKVLNKLANPPEDGFVTIQGLEGARGVLSDIAQNFKRAKDQGAATAAIKQLDEFLSTLPDEAVLAGSATGLRDTINAARGNYAAAKRSDDISGRTYEAEVQAGRANSGQNFENSLRQRFSSILTKDKDASGYTPEEIAQVEKLVFGTKPQNALRATGNMMGGGLGIGASIPGIAGALGAATVNPWMGLLATAPVAGLGIKKLANALARGKAGALDEATRARSPLYQSMPEIPATSQRSPEARIALIRALMLSQQQQ